MKADHATQLRLLAVQAIDSSLDRLAARRRNLPELAEIDKLSSRLSASHDDLVRVSTELRDLGRSQQKLDDEVDLVRARAARDQKRLDSGQITSSRELENLQTEIASLARRQNALEDETLGLMEVIEGLQTRAGVIRADQESLEAELATVSGSRDTAFAEIDNETAARRRERDAIVATLPADLLALYERLRVSSAGVGAARLVRRRCEGCHLELSGADLRDVAAAAPDEVVRCEECRRILVRTAESGL
ncbi:MULTISPECIES: zinc ribbon domain-containing protein [unclassified Frankia]|uniref:zinc ribbon domain-containing protein n=1 Tax=unclassified Frankia TaxID=2632575 RepID=UPI001EF51D30|nr:MULTISPECIES: C4-type zinc ribbon domain-containing protein [unclassified Frankia]